MNSREGRTPQWPNTKRRSSLIRKNGAAQYNLGHALLGKENAAEALPHLEKAVEMNPQLLPALDDLAWTLTIAPNRMPVDRVPGA